MPPFVESRTRVRYKETDQMAIAHHANYIVWFEIGRTDLCRAAGFPYSEIEERGLILVVDRDRLPLPSAVPLRRRGGDPHVDRGGGQPDDEVRVRAVRRGGRAAARDGIVVARVGEPRDAPAGHGRREVMKAFAPWVP